MVATLAAAEPEFPDDADIPVHPSDCLLELIVGFLAPLFMGGCAGDLSFARLAALETLASYQASTQSELVKVAQIIAFGVAAMDNLRLSMTPGLSLSMTLRLRAGASALNRSAQQNARALAQARRDPSAVKPAMATLSASAWEAPDLSANGDGTKTEVQDSIGQASGAVRQQHARDSDKPSTTAPPAAATTRGDRAPGYLQTQAEQWQTADVMDSVAVEFSATLPDDPPPTYRNRPWASGSQRNASLPAMAAASVPGGSRTGIERVDKRSRYG